MCRKDLLGDITSKLDELGFELSDSQQVMTYQANVRYPSIFAGKSDYAHFVVRTPKRVIQIAAKYQESAGTAMEKLGYTAFDAARTPYDAYLVVCGGGELLKDDRAISFLNDQKALAPKLCAITASELPSYLGIELPLPS